MDLDSSEDETEDLSEMTTDEMLSKFLPVLPKIEKKIKRISNVLRVKSREVRELKSKVEYLTNTVKTLTTENDYLHQVTNQLNLFFVGIDENPSESPSNLPAQIDAFIEEKLSVRVKVDTAHRTGIKSDKPRVIKVRFHTMRDRAAVFEKKNALKHPFYINEKAYLETNGANWEWYDPPQNGTPVNFCLDTSLHGLKYLGQRHRHLCERVFWFAAFTTAVITSSLLIWKMWTVYIEMPIVTVFSPTKKTIADIPFPAVTICNVNNVRKSYVEKYQKEFISNLSSHTSEDWKRAKIALMDLEHICETAKPFTERFIKNDLMDVLAELDRANILRNLTSNSVDLRLSSDPNRMSHEGSQKCKEMILLCIWLDQVRNCSHLFQEIETDFGYCCTFNTIPLTLLSKLLNFTSDSPNNVDEWRKADLNTDNLLRTPETSKRRFPRRQLHPGRSAGLSILLDPDLHEYFCPNIDSEGFVVAVNMPLDFPRMKDNGVSVLPNSEVFIDVRPDITMSAESIKQFPLEKRQCYFAGEFPLDHYSKYTTSNCMDECIAYRTMETCNCVQYYMPRSPKDYICRPEQYNCTYQIRTNIIQDGLGETCSKCLPTCTEIVYQTDATSLPIRNESIQKLYKEYPQYSAAHQVSIVHVYFSVDSAYPRMRKELSTIIDLLSNTGGLLGLCMGFSFLSLLEIVYYFTVRIFFRLYRRKSKLK